MYVAFWGLLFTVDFISVHDIQIYVCSNGMMLLNSMCLLS